MAVSLKHSTQATGANDPTKQVSVTAWNDDHALTGTPNTLLGFDGSGGVTEITADKNAVGLGNVDNTSDASKPVSTATTAALAGKEPTIAAGTASQYYRGDKSWQTLDKTAVGLANVTNTSDANKPVSTAQQAALDGKLSVVAGSGSFVGFTQANVEGGVVYHGPTSDVYAGVFTDLDVGYFYGQNSGGTLWQQIGGSLNANSRFDVTGSNAFEFSTAPFVGANAMLHAGSSAGSFPTLNQNTSGSAATLTTSRNFSITGGGITAAAVGFNGSAAVALNASVDAGHITLARMANLAANSFIGNNTGSSATPIAMTVAQAKTLLAITEADVANLTTDLAAKAPLASPQFTGVAYYQQSAPTAKNATATLTIADLLTLIITATSTTAVSLTLPTGTLTDAGILSGALPTNEAFEWYVINLGSSSGAVTILAGTGHTIVGSATVAIGTSARFLTRKTATNTFVTYRIA